MQAERAGELHERIVRHVRDVITVVGTDGRVLFINDAVRELEGSDPDEAVGRESISYVHPDDQALTLERRRYLLGAPGRTTTTVLRIRSADGGWRHVETHGINLVDDPEVQGLVYITRDVEDRARAEMSLVHALRVQRVVAELGVRALRSSDLDAVLSEGLEWAASVLGAAETTLLLAHADGRLRVRLQHAAEPAPPGEPWEADGMTQAAATLSQSSPTLAEDDRTQGRFARTPRQLARGVRAELDVLLEGLHGPLGVLAVAMTEPRSFSPVEVQFLQGVANVLAGALERHQQEQSALTTALHDPLTGLPTRTLLADRLAHALARIGRSGGRLALLLVDLDRFKAVNDDWGHAAGDAVLRVLGPRLAACVRTSDTVARYGGDEFVVLCEDGASSSEVERIVAAVRQACSEPLPLPNGASVVLAASIGVAWSSEEGADADALLAAADVAMYRDKRRAERP